MKVFNLIFCLLFVLSALLQYNDPDPYIWIPLYLLGALICFLAFRKKFHRSWYILALAIYIPYAVYLFFNPDGVLSWWQEHEAENIVQSMKATKPWIEETREFLGLLLLILALVVNWIWLGKKIKPSVAGSKSHSSGIHQTSGESKR